MSNHAWRVSVCALAGVGALTVGWGVCGAAMGQPPSSQPPSPAEPDRSSSKTKADYVEVPLSGEFGKEILAGGVKKALARAKSEGVRHVVFVMDSGGGVVEDAKAISDVMKEFDGSFKYHAVIKRAFSASLWVLVNCDDWFCPTGAAGGAAVVFKRKIETGAVEVDAKLNGAVAATLATMAEQKGHPGDVIRAMVLMEAKLYLNPEAGAGGSRLSAVKAEGGVEVDNETTVLSVSSEQMVQWGLAKLLPDGNAAEQVGKVLGEASWRSAGPAGTAGMKSAASAFAAAGAERDKAYKQYQDAVRQMVQAVKAFATARDDAGKVDPNAIHVYEDEHGRKSKTDLNRLESAMDEKITKLAAAVESARGIGNGQSTAKRAAAAYEIAHKRMAEAAGLAVDHLGREAVDLPEVPKDLQSAAQQCSADLAYWQQQKVQRIGHK